MVKGKSKPSHLITFLSDFGYSESYVAQVKGVILCINPWAEIIDITHDVPSGDIQSASFLLWSAYKYFPKKTVHLSVVDPGVGTERKGIIIETDRYLFVGPDNGLFTMPLREERIRRIIEINNRLFGKISNTFHGRDVFGPVAGKLSLGIDAGEFGRKITPDKLKFLEIEESVTEGERIYGRVLYIDKFGNLITNIHASAVMSRKIEVRIKGERIIGLSKTYGDTKPGVLIALINSFDLLEIAISSGSAAEKLNCGVGERVVVNYI